MILWGVMAGWLLGWGLVAQQHLHVTPLPLRRSPARRAPFKRPPSACLSLPLLTRRDLWQYCGAVFDGGRIPIASREGSTIVDLCGAISSADQAPGTFAVLRRGVAAENVVTLLVHHFGLVQVQREGQQ